jgi:diguanylate cyclase (GGDEF)-like protein
MRLLAELEQSPTGRAICGHVREVLETYESSLAEARQSGLNLSQALLDAWLSRLDPEAPETTELRLLRLRLQEAPDAAETASLLRRIQGLSRDLPAVPESVPVPAEAAMPEPVQEPIQAPLPETISERIVPPGADAVAVAVGEPDDDAQPHPAASQARSAPHIATDAADGERRVDLTYRKHLAEKRDRIQQIQETLVQQVSDVIKQNEKFGVLLEVEHESLRQTDSMEELEALKGALISEVGRLREGHNALARKLDTASKYLHIIGTEGQYLNDELTRVHILSLTDELTDLPNRRAFLRRLEDEVARVQRYGYPLSLALIDMDSFKSVNDRYGHGAGDEVLRNFASNVLSIFRHHDMVARYGGEEFAVLLPNTDRNGALRALEKVRKRTSESSYQFGGKTMAMPTFSAGISLYRPGETPGSLIERADKALYQAKRLGRNRIELAQHDGAEAAAR